MSQAATIKKKKKKARRGQQILPRVQRLFRKKITRWMLNIVCHSVCTQFLLPVSPNSMILSLARDKGWSREKSTHEGFYGCSRWTSIMWCDVRGKKCVERMTEKWAGGEAAALQWIHCPTLVADKKNLTARDLPDPELHHFRVPLVLIFVCNVRRANSARANPMSSLILYKYLEFLFLSLAF